MSDTASRSTAGVDGTAAGQAAQIAYTCTLLLSACLMFLVQPLVAKLSLPLLGGTPAVWAIAMCFFQAMLLLGYGYAHLLRIAATPVQGLIIHALLLILAVLLLPFGRPETAEPITGVMAGLQLFGVFAKLIGFPFFVLSATAPLLQSWFGKLDHPRAGNPYFLYAASNIGSIGALVLYPALIEPLLPVSDQAYVWSGLFSALAVAILLCGHMHIAYRTRVAPVQQAQHGTGSICRVTAENRFYWVVMAFIPSALLIAWSNYLAADIASAPFLWLPPLVLFLLTFVLEFRNHPPISARVLTIAQILSVPATLLFQFALPAGYVAAALLATAISFFATALICHRQLYNARPDAAHLTDFYMMMSLGGVLGGLFVSLFAPILFSSNIEYPLLLLAGLMLRGPLEPAQARTGFPFSLMFVGKLIAMAGLFGAGLAVLPWRLGGAPLELAVLGCLPIGLLLGRQFKVAAIAVVAIAALLNVGRMGEIVSLRNYFGSLGVIDVPGDGLRWLRHGTTLHGAQYIHEIEAGGAVRPTPLSYYSSSGGLAQALRLKQDLLRLEGRLASVGIVGLGTGAMACHSQEGEKWRYYEIDPDVIRIARDPRYFSFLSRCAGDAPVIEGDARLSVAHEPDKVFDYLLIDAFSSDSIPSHLLTAEAVALYVSKLKPDGVLVFHLSNRFMDLPPFVAATAHLADAGLGIRMVVDDTPKLVGATPSVSVVLSQDRNLLQVMDETLPKSAPVRADLVAPWTDNYTNVTAAILRNYFDAGRP